MVILAGLFVAISFLYSPQVEKRGQVFITKPMTISQERKTPAYYLFQQSKKLSLPLATETSLYETVSQQVALNDSNNLTETNAQNHIPTMVFQKSELLALADRSIQSLIESKKDSVLFSETSSHENTNVIQKSETQGAYVKGTFELIEGVGIVDHIISLKRVFEGQDFELGQVNLKNGTYEIQIGSFEGDLVAEIKDQAGFIVGEDRQKISGLKQVGNYFSGPSLKVGQPSAFGLNVRNVDDRYIVEGNYKSSFFNGLYDLKKTTDIYPNVASLSSTIAQIIDTTSKNASVLTLRLAKDKTETVLFSRSWLDGVRAYLSAQLQIQFPKQTGFIIGRVLKDGKPVAGAQVVLENQVGLEPFYLDQFLIPQVKQSTTSANGYFIIPSLNEGSYQVVAYLNDRHIGHQLYFVKNEFISYQEISTTGRPQSILARSFDSFSGLETEADIFLTGEEEPLSTENGSARYKTTSLNSLEEIFVRPQDRQYAQYTYLNNSRKNHLHLPQISDLWIEQVQKQMQIPIQNESSVFIGFLPKNDYNLHLSASDFDLRQIVYFNAQGLPSNKPEIGGGFILFNLPLEPLEIIVQDNKSERTFSKTLWATSNKLYVSHFSE